MKLTPDLKNHFFNNHHVAALAWAIGSAPLMSDSGSSVLRKMLPEEWFQLQLQNNWNWILQLDDDPQPLIDFVETEHPKLLGKYFETLIVFWIQNDPRFDLIGKNIQFRDDHNTIGEVDLLVKDLESGELWQIELACKYYAGHLNTAAFDHWIGPNGTDSLYQKMTKLEKQTSIFKTPIGRNFLKSNGLSEPVVKIIMKGFFFHHFQMLARSKSPRYAHIHYNSGWFVYLHELESLFGSLQQWIILPKFLWSCLYNFNSGTENILSGQQMISHCKEEMSRNKKAILIAQVEVGDEYVKEISRGFVLHDQWPNIRSVYHH